MKKRIVIISEYFYPVQRNDAKLLTDIVETLCENNDGDISVICTSDLNDEKELTFLEGKIERLKGSKFNDRNIFLRILKFIILTFRLVLKSITYINKSDRVFSTTNPAFLFPILVLLKKIKKFEYTLLVYDVFPENLVAANIIKENSFLLKITKKIYNWAYSNTDRLIVIGRDMEEVLLKKINNKVPISLIENWCDYKTIIPESKKDNKIIQKFKLENKKVFLFSGNFGRVQGIQNLLNAAKLVKNNDFALLFIGDGVMKKVIQLHIDNKKSNNVFYVGSFPSHEQNTFLNACDVAIISLSSSMYGLGVPSKSYYNMAAEKPLLYIGDEKSEIAKVIDEHNIGWVIEPDNQNELALQFEKICNEPEKFKVLGKKSREVVENLYSKEVILNKYKNLFN